MSNPTLYLDGRVAVHAGDSASVIKTLADNSIDACVCDPPYALTSIVRRFGPTANGHVSTEPKAGATGAYARAAKGFMGKAWDNGSTAFSVDFWREVFRVLKPGAHVVAFGGTRTYHRLACAIEDAGFECRDAVMWHYGTGFPKSHDVSKGIDRAAGASREVVGPGQRHNSKRCAVAHGDTERLAGGVPGLTIPATESARKWEGWGTALKPATEILFLAKKPLTYKQNVETIGSNITTLWSRLWLILPANVAKQFSTLSPSVYGVDPSVFAQWSADELSNTRDALSEAMGMSQFELALISSLSTVSSWSATWAEASEPANTSTIETELNTITDLRTLRFSVSRITAESIIQAHKTGQWSIANASSAERYFNAIASRLAAIRELSAVGNVLNEDAISCLDGIGRIAPNTEIIFVGRKPLSEPTVAANVLRWGTGAINVDATRIGTTRNVPASHSKTAGNIGAVGIGARRKESEFDTNMGRWPANLCHDGSAEVLAAFPYSDGAQGDVTGREPSDCHSGVYSGPRDRQAFAARGDSGSAARFFFSAKADADDRLGSKHPTVKPVDLMQWLCRLVTPPPRVVLVCESCNNTPYEKTSLQAVRSPGDEPPQDSEILFAGVPSEELRDPANVVPRVRENGSRSAADILLNRVSGAGVQEAQDITAKALREVREDLSAKERRDTAFLQPGLRGEVERNTSSQRAPENDSGLLDRLHAWSSDGDEDRICDGTPGRDGEESRSHVGGVRGCSSYQRGQGQQSVGKSIVDDEGRSRSDAEAATENAHNVPALCRANEIEQRCPKCNGPLKKIIKRSVILDPFAGTGTTGAAAWREGFRAVLIEREPEYQADIARRMALAGEGQMTRKHESAKARANGKAPDHGPLFGGSGLVGGADRTTGNSPIRTDDRTNGAQMVRIAE